MIGANVRTVEALNQSQSLAEELRNQSQELQRQQSELQKSNRDLEAQTQSLKTSEELLTEQREELQQVNEELEEKATLLFEQKRSLELKNKEVELSRHALEAKAEQLSVSSKYKSEFLANMSHELRTPLNSLLILAKTLADNKELTLTPKQIEYARTIQASGTDLLNLINEVLDLSKVEAGKIEINLSDQSLAKLGVDLERDFRPLAEQKGLEFVVECDPAMAPSLKTDGQRLQQILRNLLTNAFKFTDTGRVSVQIGTARNVTFLTGALRGVPDVVAFAVKDSGIGIAEDKQQLIFEAFRQADGTTSRSYGGTGLGLSISRELSTLLGGEIRVTSAPGQGSTFTFFLPRSYVPPDSATSAPDSATAPFVHALADAAPLVTEESLRHNPLADDRDAIHPGDRVLLIVEDDKAFAHALLDLAREKGFKTVVAVSGDVGLALAYRVKPDAIILDIGLPVVDGLAVLARLKQHRDTRHIPVHIFSGRDKKNRGLRLGARAYLEKPISKEVLENAFVEMARFLERKVRHLLVVEDDPVQQRAILDLIGNGDVVSTTVGSANEALEQLQTKHFDCMVLDVGLPDMTGFELLDQVTNQEALRTLPIIIYTGKELTKKERTRLTRYAKTTVIKAAKSPERLLDETALFLHRIEANLPEEKRRVFEQMHNTETLFTGKKVLVVDDDVRNVYAITGVLEANGMDVIFAASGKDALEALAQTPDVDLILMDVMMPDMDGYETMRAIRKLTQFIALPIIALTAKAMTGDREKCMDAGASDYVTKPVDTDQLLSLLHVWMYR
jgi:CheY-like chemotaxis protein/signal transduction histidine kinase